MKRTYNRRTLPTATAELTQISPDLEVKLAESTGKPGGSSIRKKTRQAVTTTPHTRQSTTKTPAPASGGGGACPECPECPDCPVHSNDTAPVKQKAFPILLMLVLFFLAAEAG